MGRHAAPHPACRPTLPRPPPGPSGNQVCRGSGFAGESGFAEKSGSAGNRDQSEKCSTCANSLAYCGIRMASATKVVALLGQAIRISKRMEDFVSECMVDLSIRHSVLAMIYPALSCEFFSFICIHITSPGNRHWLTSPVRNCLDLGRSNNEIRRRMHTYRVHDAHCRRSRGIVHTFSYR